MQIMHVHTLYINDKEEEEFFLERRGRLEGSTPRLLAVSLCTGEAMLPDEDLLFKVIELSPF